MLSTDTTKAALLGQLLLEGRLPVAVLSVTPGRLPNLGGAHVLVVTEGLLWLATPQVFDGPAIASVPLADVGPVRIEDGARTRLELTVSGRRLTYTVVDGPETTRAFAAAVEDARA